MYTHFFSSFSHNFSEAEIPIWQTEIVSDHTFGQVPKINAEPHSSVDGIEDLRTGDRWFDHRLGQYSFRD